MKKLRVGLSAIVYCGLILGLIGMTGSWAVAGEPLPMVVHVHKANVRSAPDLHSQVVLQLGKGSTVQAVSRRGDWYKIRLDNGNTGWMYHSILALAPVNTHTTKQPAPTENKMPESKSSLLPAEKETKPMTIALQETLADDFRQGRAQYVQGNYEEALQHLRKAAKADPENAAIQYHIGLTYQGMLDYPEAEKSFARAVAIDPSMGDGWSHLGEMLYRRGKHAEARAALEKAETNGARPAYTAYIKGLVLMELHVYDDAIASLQQSQEIEPAFKQKATYAIGMVYSKKNNKKAAEKAFREAIAIDPKSPVGVYADFGLKYLYKPQRRVWHIDLGYSFQYDDNVILNPGGTSSIPTDQNDFTHVLNLHLGLNPENSGPFGIRADASYYKSLHHKLSYMDVDGLGLSITPSYSNKLGVFSLEGRADFYYVGRNHYLDIYSVYPSFGFDIGKTQHGILNGVVQKKNFFNQPLSIIAENRDANNYSAGYMHYVYTQKQQGYVGLGYAFDFENARGDNWDYLGHRIIASVLHPFGKGVGFRFNGDYYLQKYRNAHTIFGVKRDDKVLSLSPMLTYTIKRLTLQLYYSHVRAKSNVAVYEYKRNIVGAGFEFSY